FDVVPLKHNGRVRVPFFDYLNSTPSIDFLQSCYGLFLCKSKIGNLKNVISRYFICNPSTKKFKELSSPENPFKDYIKFYVNMVFDPLKSPYYKVICVRKAPDQPSNYKPDIHWNCYWKDSFYFDAENEPLTMPISTTEAPQMCSYMGKCRGVLYVSVTYFVLMC
ncbi:hypothetical protein ERO13_D13G165650v2, partial [Gossypium hirsutum]